MKRLPSSAEDIPLSHALLGLLRVRAEQTFQKNKVYLRLMRRMVHIFCQSVEQGVERHLTSNCPQPSLEEKYHPYLKKSRMRGSKALNLALVQRFQARGGGYVSSKEEISLKALGILDESSFGNRSAREYCARLLCKTVDFMERFQQRSSNKNVNLCFDVASISTEQVASWNSIVKSKKHVLDPIKWIRVEFLLHYDCLWWGQEILMTK